MKVFFTFLAAFSLFTSPVSGGSKVDELVFDGQELILTPYVDEELIRSFDNIIVFGDSLSDDGNLHRRTFGLYVPDSVYYKNRFSNGPIWLDYVKSALSSRSDNWAVGGAETSAKRGLTYFFIPGSDRQIKSSLKSLKKLDLSSTLGVFWIGSNNYLNLGNDKPEKVLEGVEGQLKGLLDQGLQTVLVGTLPELANLPVDPKNSPVRSPEEFKSLISFHNEGLKNIVSKLQKLYPESRIAIFEAYKINDATDKAPDAFGFRSTQEACYQGDLRGKFYEQEEFCSDPLGVKFWDFVHPNSKMHCYYAVQFLDDLSQSMDLPYEQHEALFSCMSL